MNDIFMQRVMPRVIFFVTCFVLITTSGYLLAETGKKPDPESVKLGKALYEKHCQACHQKDGVGAYPVPWGIRNPNYIPPMPLNETSHAWHHSDEQLVNTILNGIDKRSMPAWRHVLSEKEATEIVAYIKSLWSPKILACQGPKHMSCM